MTSNSQFFDELSDDYDVMINFENALKNKTSFFKNFLLTNYKMALDLGCGTGADSIALSKLGLQVDAIDHSKGMLQQARKNAEKFDAKINFIESGLTDFSLKDKRYDFIVSLGNTIANINMQEVSGLVSKLYGILNFGGEVLFQIVNYAKLPKSGIHILNVYENDAVSILRKYNINTDNIDFIIEKNDKKKNQVSQIITTLYPHSKIDFEKTATEIGFTSNFYGNLKKDKFVATDSPNLVVQLKKVK
ncbi:class I SAM-dependent methyltransferase [Aureibaculum sp. A20]|uniref:Class I SAM-dependent methyltransferase n=1 Tax=Aureibaculum flavum TaxID=2795986 RepID=A0ABS0WQ40_9FLAO|nr:class I SAM-dependent methyltransferase [Aureibaculum flavum]MBJ2174051.1 class I SAM-dependent methyltransferase [Aureibaculum flavum]